MTNEDRLQSEHPTDREVDLAGDYQPSHRNGCDELG
jgi:hypothetical protein